MADQKFPIEASHIMMFARAVGDPNPIYFDAEYAAGTEVGGIIAPPTFTAAAMQFQEQTPMRPVIGQPWFGSGRTPTGVERQRNGGGSGLHAEMHYEYFKPLRPGVVLTGRSYPGNSWEKEGRRGGTLHFAETVTDFTNEDGDVVLRSRSVFVRTSRPGDQEK